MSAFKSEVVTLNVSAKDAYKKFTNLEGLREALKSLPEDKIPADKREMLEKIEITADSLSLPAGPVGTLTLRLTHTEEPTLIEFSAENSPVPITITMHITPLTDTTCSACVEIDVHVPAMMAPMIKGPMQGMADQISTLLTQIPM